jgi:hypothetical protein
MEMIQKPAQDRLKIMIDLPVNGGFMSEEDLIFIVLAITMFITSIVMGLSYLRDKKGQRHPFQKSGKIK